MQIETLRNVPSIGSDFLFLIEHDLLSDDYLFHGSADIIFNAIWTVFKADYVLKNLKTL